jgi:Ca2+-transporting ATPase
MSLSTQDTAHGAAASSAPTWHTLTVAAALTELDASMEGLSAAEAASRLTRYGPNELQAAHRVSPWSLLLDQFKNVLIIILLVAAALSVFLGHGVEAVAIAVIVLFAVLLGFVQEYRAERAIEALRQMAAPTAKVVRDGKETETPAREVVPGDMIMLRAGDRVPADARVVESINLKAEEAALTGESLAVSKHSDALAESALGAGDRRNMVFGGTAITYGRGRAVVVETGMRTEFGKIAQMLETIETGKTPLQEQLDRVGALLARAAFVVVGIIVALGLFRGQDLIEMLIFGIALAVAVVPEALPAVVTISLAIGVQRMVKHNALMRRLAAVETLGSTSVICSDKTGTLTKDEMTVREIVVAGHHYKVSGAGYEPHGEFSLDGAPVTPTPALQQLLEAGVLASDATLVHDADSAVGKGAASGRWEIKGDPTEGALVVVAAKAGLARAALDPAYPRRHEIPFTSETKRMTTLHEHAGTMVAFAKGAPEVILRSCTRYVSAVGEAELTDAARGAIETAARTMASQALRVLAIAMRTDATPGNAEHGMVFLGLVGMIDPPRPEVKEAIRICEAAGIKPVMITGDHPLTARAIAQDLGMLKRDRVVTGAELETIDPETFAREVESIEVYARVSPAHKLRVVTAFQERGHIVAMTGDGVNDAPALKKADIGIAMGITGTDVSKEAAAMTLTDDNFASIVAAVKEGRGIFDNIKKYLMYLLSSNIGEIGLMAGATLLGVPLPLTAVQILYVNLATDGLPALALAVDPPDSDLMQRRPRNAQAGIFTRPVVSLMLVGGIWSTLINLGVFLWAMNSGRSQAEAMTMTFVSLVLIQFFKAYNFRSDRLSVLRKPFANKWLNLAIGWELLLLVLIVYVPFLQSPFGAYSLPWIDWVIVIVLAATVSPVLELTKVLVRRGHLGVMS